MEYLYLFVFNPLRFDEVLLFVMTSIVAFCSDLLVPSSAWRWCFFRVDMGGKDVIITCKLYTIYDNICK